MCSYVIDQLVQFLLNSTCILISVDIPDVLVSYVFPGCSDHSLVPHAALMFVNVLHDFVHQAVPLSESSKC